MEQPVNIQSNLFSGKDTYDRSYQLFRDKSGQWWHRSREYDRERNYGYFTAWGKCSNLDAFVYVTSNAEVDYIEKVKHGWGQDAIGVVNNKIKQPTEKETFSSKKVEIINNIIKKAGFNYVDCVPEDFLHVYINFDNFKKDLQQAKSMGDLDEIGLFVMENSDKKQYFLK